MKDHKKPEKQKLLVLYGSQTGTGEDIAERVTREAQRFHFEPFLSTMDSYDFSELEQETRPICFICSTTGQGEEPENMKRFWKFLLRKSLPADFLSKVRFSVLGLGDSSYVKFNFVAKKLHKRLVQLGASPIIDLGLGDDQHDLGPDAVTDPWLIRFWEQLIPNFSTDSNLNDSAPLLSKFSLLRENELPGGIETSTDHPVTLCKLLGSKRMTTEDHFQDVRLFSIDMAGSGLSYEPGDVLKVLPKNLEENVELFFQVFPHLESRREEKFYLVTNPDRPWAHIPHELEKVYPQPWTLENIVKNYLDIQAVPKRYFFELLSYFTTSNIENEKLKEFSSTEGQQDLYAYSNRPKRNVLEALQDFPHATENIPEDYIFDLIGPIKPRAFSIASSMKAKGTEVQILVALVKYQTKLQKPRMGLCSNWLARLSPGDTVPIWVEKGSFHFPPQNEVPVIMVGPGTGIAPFRSLISARSDPRTDLTLFFGCRFEKKDFYFRDEWADLKEKKQLKLFPAFSRDNPDTSRTYVQHKIREEAKLIWDLIENKGACIYIAGNAKRMPIDVAEAFLGVFQDSGCPHPDAYMKDLVKADRYQTEVWS